MFKRLLFLLMILCAYQSFAQAPQGVPYQAVARNSSGSILANTNISVRFTIRDSIATGAIKYRETHSVTTSAQGMFNLNVGKGSAVTGTFSGINWGTNAKFIQVEMDPAAGSAYIDMGTTQMMSVPYSLSTGALKLTVSATGDTLYSGGGNYIKVPGISAANTPPLSVGMSYGGGIVAYILVAGDPGYVAGETHGLIAAPSDQSTGQQWGCYGTLLGGTSTAIGSGAANTSTVSTACESFSAARLCQDLVLNGYSDWYLPSFDELMKLYNNRSTIGGFANYYYWSSSENSHPTGYLAWYVYFLNGTNGGSYKNGTFFVRAVRAF